MAITNYAIDVATPPIEGDWQSKSMYSADVTAAESLLAAVSSGNHYIRKIVISCGTNSATISLGGGETTGAITDTRIGPIAFSASTAHPFEMSFGEKAMKLARGTAFVIDGVTSAPVWIYFEYKTV